MGRKRLLGIDAEFDLGPFDKGVSHLALALLSSFGSLRVVISESAPVLAFVRSPVGPILLLKRLQSFVAAIPPGVRVYTLPDGQDAVNVAMKSKCQMKQASEADKHQVHAPMMEPEDRVIPKT